MRTSIVAVTLAVGAVWASAVGSVSAAGTEQKVPVVFSGGYDTDPRDHGRPVVLIAAALGVPDQVFRDAFSGVRPARGGGGPTPEQARQNKQVLLNALGRYGITNERLDEVSNYYRYNGARGEMWRSRKASAYAAVRDGKVTGFTITEAGAGYSSAPTATLEGMPDVHLSVSLSYGKDFATNGSISKIVVGGDAPKLAPERRRGPGRRPGPLQPRN